MGTHIGASTTWIDTVKTQIGGVFRLLGKDIAHSFYRLLRQRVGTPKCARMRTNAARGKYDRTMRCIFE